MIKNLVSILIPVYNRAPLIEETVRSALAQTYTNIEIIIVDNASTDGTWHILESLARDDRRIRIYRNETNIGPVRNWITCVERATGEYSKILWSDDLMAPSFLERCIPYIRDPDVGFVYSAARFFESENDLASGQVVFNKSGTGVFPSSVFIEGTISDADFPCSPGCALFRSGDLKNNLWLDVPNHLGSDFSMHAIGNDLLIFLLTAKVYKNYAVIAEPLSYFRVHQGSISVAEGAGRIVYHYDIVKAYFVNAQLMDVRYQKRLNARIFLHLRRYGDAPYGIRKVQDFYPDGFYRSIDFGLLFRYALGFTVKAVSKFFYTS